MDEQDGAEYIPAWTLIAIGSCRTLVGILYSLLLATRAISGVRMRRAPAGELYNSLAGASRSAFPGGEH